MIKYLTLLLVMIWSTVTVAFDCDAEYKDTLQATRIEAPQIVVNEEKLYFHSYPDERCINDNVYIIKNDIVNTYGTSGEFTFVNFAKKAGWVKTAALQKIDIKPISLDQAISFLDFIVKNEHLTMWPEQTIDDLLSQNGWLRNNLVECIESEYGIEIFINDKDLLIINSKTLEYDYYKERLKFVPNKVKNKLGCLAEDFAYEPNSIRSISFSHNTETLRGIKIGSSLTELEAAYKDNLKIASTDENEVKKYSIHYRNFIMEFLVYQNKVQSINLSHTVD